MTRAILALVEDTEAGLTQEIERLQEVVVELSKNLEYAQSCQQRAEAERDARQETIDLQELMIVSENKANNALRERLTAAEAERDRYREALDGQGAI
jgi:hypothetical protein